jgi:serine/threonine protein kinase
LPVGDRAAYLEQACGSDTALRAEVESLLVYDKADANLVDGVAAQHYADLLTTSVDALSSLAGQSIHHYQILRLLGAGGMGEVWLAKDTRLGRYVALKLLPNRLAADGALSRRLTHEARAASALNHPNILTVHDIGEHEGRPYVVSEYVEGISLREKLRRGPLPFGEAADIALQVAEGLSAAHGIGLVHRDIKPENVMVRPDGRVKVLDFGIAKRLTAEDQAESSGLVLTRSGAVLGTVAYLSPEQARGEPVDTRTDLWSLGAVLYEMATRRQAFTGRTAASIFDAILNRMPVPALQLNSRLPPGLEQIVGKALEKDRERRYQSAADIQHDLNRLVRDGGLAMGAGSQAVANSTERARRRKLIAAAACMVALTSICGGAFYVRNRGMHPGMNGITSVAVLPFYECKPGRRNRLSGRRH